MIPLNTQIIAYLTVNNIPYTDSDYQTGIPPGGVDQILYWNAEALGPEPTQEQLDQALPIYEGEQIAAQNKATATSLLQETDWTCTVDITNPEYSNPYLANQPEFLAYRSTVRSIAVNPPTTPAVFPEQPQEIWADVPPPPPPPIDETETVDS
jgi:hypothetical protein